MRLLRLRFLLAMLVLGVALALGCSGGCGKGGSTLEREQVGLPSGDLTRDLKPLPDAPTLNISPESLPGANGELAVVAARPQGQMQGEVRPTITFSNPVKSLAMIEAGGAKEAPVARIEPAIEGEWRWLGSASAEFVPKAQVPYSTEYTVTVPAGLRAIDGSTLKADHVYRFNTPRPQVQDVTPFRGFQWLRPDQTVKVIFNQPVDDASLLSAATFKVNGKPVKAKLIAKASIAEERRKAEEAARAKAQAESRHFERQGFEERGFKNQQTRYELAPEQPFPLAAEVVLQIGSALKGAQGPLTMNKDEEITYRTYGPLVVSDARMCGAYVDYCPYGPMVVITTNEVDVASLKGKVTITPPVEIDWERVEAWKPHEYYGEPESPYFSLPGKYRPGVTYKVSIAAGTADVFKQTVGAFSDSARTSDLRPSLNLGGAFAVIEASQGLKLPVDVTNLKAIDLEAWKLTVPEAATLLGNAYRTREASVNRPPDLATQLPFKDPDNSARVHRIDLGAMFGEAKTGLAMVRVDSPQLSGERRYRARTAIAQITDLAVHFKFAPQKSLAWVTRLSTGAPVDGAEVQALDLAGKVLWTGTSDAAGLADVPGAVELVPNAKTPNSWEVPVVVVAASKDGDTAITASNWSSGVEPYEFGLSQGWEDKRPQSAGFLFTDRGIYRPGDKVYLKGVSRFRQVGALKAPAAGSKLSLEVHTSRGDKLITRALPVSRFGTIATEVEIPKDAPTGYFTVAVEGVVSGGKVTFEGGFRVEEYRAPQFKVEVTTPKAELLAGDPLEAQVLARYLFGGSMSDAQVKWSVHSATTSFSPDGAQGFTFGQETWWWDDREPQASGGFFGSGEGRVDAKGALAVKAGAVQAPAERPWTYTIEAEVTDVNRQAVAGRTALTVHPAAYYVGLRAPTGFPEVNKETSLETLVVDPSGKKIAGRKVDVTVSLRTWKSVRQKEAGGGFSTISEPVEEKVHGCAVTSTEDAVKCAFKPTSPGFYIVRAGIEDDQKRKHAASLGIYVVGSGFVAWQRNDTDRLELVPDKTTYDVGDVAKVLIKSPYPEARALLTTEREGVLSRTQFVLKGSVQTVEIPITEEMVPNVFAGVMLMRQRVQDGGIETGDDPGRPAARVGLVKLNVEKKVKRLSVKVATDRQEYQPGQEVTVDVDVKDSAGKGAASEVTLYAVDDAVLRLTSYTTPDPLSAIFPERALSVRIGEPLLHLVRRRNYGEKGEEQGGGGGADGEGKGIRSNFKTTVFFNPTLETAADGHAQVKFKLPDNLTTFRIMAVAITTEDRFGSGDTEVKVNKPLLMLAALPRFARVGDKFEAGVVVHTYGGASAGEVTVTAQAENAKLLGPAEQKVVVSDTAPKEVRFPFTVERPGIATFRFQVSRGADRDGVEEKIPVELPVTLEAVATYGDTQNQRIEGIAPPHDVWPGLGGMEVTMASTSMGNFQEGLRQLVEYPYGCLEQQASRLIPFVALREIGGKFGLKWPSPTEAKTAEDEQVNALLRAFLFDPLDVSKLKDPDQVVAATVASIGRLQEPDGSFRYWSEDSCPSSWASVYATLALERAQQVGFTVAAEKLSRAEAYTEKVLGGGCHPCELSCPMETRVLAAYVLARAGKPKPSYYGELYAAREKLPLFSQALLADAIFVGGGDRAQAKALLTELLNHAKESPKGVHFEETQSQTYATLWHSDTRTTGAVLQTLTSVAPDHPYVSKIAHYLTDVRRGDGQWRSTQEAAFSLMGLTEVLRTKEKDTPQFNATLAMGEKPLMEQKFEGRSMDVKRKTVGIDELVAAAGGKEQKLAFKKEGPGVLYYSALLRYAPKELPLKSLDRGLFVQRWFEPYAGGGQGTKFYAGDLVRVRIRVASNQERHWAAFEVPLPAGLEPVDTTLATTAAQTRAPDEEQRGEGYEYDSDEDQSAGSAYEEEEGRPSPWAFRFWSPFNHVEQRDSKVVLFADHLPPGVHVSSFVARATTPGTFLLKPATGALMYEPEVFGRSEGGSFEVVLPSTVSAK